MIFLNTCFSQANLFPYFVWVNLTCQNLQWGVLHTVTGVIFNRKTLVSAYNTLTTHRRTYTAPANTRDLDIGVCLLPTDLFYVLLLANCSVEFSRSKEEQNKAIMKNKMDWSCSLTENSHRSESDTLCAHRLYVHHWVSKRLLFMGERIHHTDSNSWM